MYKASFLIFIFTASAMSASFTVTLGKQSLYSVKITVDNGDTSNRTKYYSLCPSYRYIQYFKFNLGSMGSYDYKITVIRNMKSTGSLFLFNPQYNYTKTDTLKCDSLGFQPGSNSYSSISDTIISDTSIYYWIYPRPTKMVALSSSQKQIYGFSNHLKLLLRTATFSDSLIITREKLFFDEIRMNNHSIKNYTLKSSLWKPDNNVNVYNFKGIKLNKFEKNSILIIQDKKHNILYK